MAKLIIAFLLGFFLLAVVAWIYVEGIAEGRKRKGGDKKKK